MMPNKNMMIFQAVNAPPDPKKKALLNDQPTANVYSQLQKLTSQNPACKYCLHLKFAQLDEITTYLRNKTLILQISISIKLLKIFKASFKTKFRHYHPANQAI